THPLHQRVAQRRRFVWPGNHWHSERISQPLVEPGVACPSTEYMHLINYSTSEPTDLLKHLAVAQYQAFHDAACECRRCLKRSLPVFHKIAVDRSWHALRSQEAVIVRIDEGS